MEQCDHYSQAARQLQPIAGSSDILQPTAGSSDILQPTADI